MKQILLFIVGLTIAGTACSQAFHKHSVVVDIGAGLNISKTAVIDAYNTQMWTGSGFSTVRIQKDTNDKNAAVIYPLTVEYGVKNWLGIAGKVAYSKYLTGTDSVSGVKSDVRGIDAGVIFNLHLIKTKRFDMPIGLSLGYSNIKFTGKDSLQTMAKDNGLTYGFAAVPRFYLNNHFGFALNVGYIVYTYPNLLFSNQSDPNLNDDIDRVFKLQSNSTNIGISMLVKF